MTVRSDYLDENTFRYDYYSGANIGIFIGGNQVTDAVGFEVSLQQNKTPIWGYASSLFDGVASGVIQVSGVMWLNFTQAQMMSAFIANAEGKPPLSQLDFGLDLDQLLFDQKAIPINLGLIEEYRHALQQTYWDNLSVQENYGYTEAGGANTSNSSYLPHARPDQHLKGFDIRVTYGVPFQQSFNSNTKANSTVRVIKDVRIVGFGQTISIDGEPIIETYPFIAKEVV